MLVSSARGHAQPMLDVLAHAGPHSPFNPSEEPAMIYELRIYHCVSGRLPALLKRFDTITLKLWEKHGIKQAGFWTVGIGGSNQDLYYMLQWESLAERDKKWTAFGTDPEWLAKRAETEKDGAIVASLENMILQPTAFSSVK
jgi:NIPSNAP